MQIDAQTELKGLVEELKKAQEQVLRIQGAIVFLQKKAKESQPQNGTKPALEEVPV